MTCCRNSQPISSENNNSLESPEKNPSENSQSQSKGQKKQGFSLNPKELSRVKEAPESPTETLRDDLESAQKNLNLDFNDN